MIKVTPVTFPIKAGDTFMMKASNLGTKVVEAYQSIPRPEIGE